MSSIVENVVMKPIEIGFNCVKKTVNYSGAALVAAMVFDTVNYHLNLNDWNDFAPCNGLKITTLGRIFSNLRLARDPDSLNELCEVLKNYHPGEDVCQGECDNGFTIQQSFLFLLGVISVSTLFASSFLNSPKTEKKWS